MPFGMWRSARRAQLSSSAGPSFAGSRSDGPPSSASTSPWPPAGRREPGSEARPPSPPPARKCTLGVVGVGGGLKSPGSTGAPRPWSSALAAARKAASASGLSGGMRRALLCRSMRTRCTWRHFIFLTCAASLPVSLPPVSLAHQSNSSMRGASSSRSRRGSGISAPMLESRPMTNSNLSTPLPSLSSARSRPSSRSHTSSASRCSCALRSRRSSSMRVTNATSHTMLRAMWKTAQRRAPCVRRTTSPYPTVAAVTRQWYSASP
mmetsp:Transcript_73456/g.207448  ORF Transcript_73456/g.207448 Transcript_73456/m.207448 type:complete len:264 (+) Transcript_73456:158-949(+)